MPNEIITTHVRKRGQLVSVDELPEQSSLMVIIRCPHGERSVRWCRRHNMCPQCCLESGVYNTSPKGRIITWGDKISQTKKGVPLTEEHKKALSEAHTGEKHSLERRVASRKNRRRGSSHPFWKDIGPIHKQLRKSMSNQIHMRLHAHSAEKSQSISKSLDYSIDDLKSHLESKFLTGMSWDNYGEWHIDHIVPDSWFNYVSDCDEEFKQCWSLDNLQPLWATDNCSKGNRFAG